MKLEDLNKEQQEHLNALETPDEALAYLRELDVELTPEELAGISGGAGRFRSDRTNYEIRW